MSKGYSNSCQELIGFNCVKSAVHTFLEKVHERMGTSFDFPVRIQLGS